MRGRPLLTRRLFSRLITAGMVPVAMTWALPTSAQNRKPATPPKRLIVMLDAGHGGRDPGAIGKAGTYEKHITLAATQELRRLLELHGEYQVEMTRTRDVFIPLAERVERARAKGAALFVSLHADALPDHAVRGASVYTLSATASDSQSATLAKRENDADRFMRNAWPGVPPDVARILGSLTKRETQTRSLRFAKRLVTHLDRDLPMLTNPARHASFEVLKAADIPSVLVEMGFMSNEKDEAALRKPTHRKMVAEAIRRAIDEYFASIGKAT
jgi:N-acetylmuramoyl-L-alanine amidase